MSQIDNKNGIALLITVFFILAISVAVGIGLRDVKKTSGYVEKEHFMIQTTTILDDMLKVLRTSKELEAVGSADTLFLFLNQSSFLPLEGHGIKAIIQIKSARAKFNINALINEDKKPHLQRVDALKEFVNLHRININFVDIVLDLMGGIKDNMTYNSDIFNKKPSLFRDYITSSAHLAEVKEFYKKTYYDDIDGKINFENLFYYSKDTQSSLDLNYATSDVWRLVTGCDLSKARELSAGGGRYKTIEDLKLTKTQKERLEHFKTTFYEPILHVSLDIIQNNHSAKVSFEYDIKTKKGSNFLYEI